MRKKQYIVPATIITMVAHELPIATSNLVSGNGASLNPETMESGDGSEAVKASSYDVWDDDWSIL